jgi:mono/diheme cytochrome c family protein
MPSFSRLSTALLLGTITAFAAAPPVDFNRDVRPVLSENCFQCHGPDEKHRMAGLRLDTKDGAFAHRKTGDLIVPGDPGKSLLYQRISHADKAKRMPPPMADRVVSEKQIDAIRRWIEQGAKWQTHWAFTAPQRPEPPAVKNNDAVRNPIDQFIQARLEREGLTPAPEADRRTLLRRLSLDLTGLPPKPEEMAAFLKDKSTDAYEKQVDRLLASPHFGERMTMDWLDAARYADTHGYHIDSHRDMWPWRDWVIKAFNSNMPFDRFTILQLAGDLVPDAGIEGKIASGFNRNHMINFEGGAIPEEYLVEYVADRVETTSGAWMGLTMGCARCHSHKYDPISHKEYYQFFAFFNNVDEKGLDGKTGNAKPLLKLPTPDQAQTEKELKAAIEAGEGALKSKEVVDAMTQWRATLTGKPVPINREGLTAHYDLDGSLTDVSGAYQNGRTLKGDPGFGPGQVSRSVSFDGQTLVTLGSIGDIKPQQPFTIEFWLKYGGSKQPMPIFEKIDSPQARRGWEMWLDQPVLVGIQKRAAHMSIRLSSQWPNAALEVRTRERFTQGEWNHVAVVSDGTGRASGLTFYVNGLPVETDILHDQLASPITNNAELHIGVKEPDSKPFNGSLDDLRFYTRGLSAAEVRKTAIEYPIDALLSGVGGKPGKTDEERIRDFYLRYVAPVNVQRQYAELRDHREKYEHLEKDILTTMVMSELKKPRETFILARGDYRNKTDKVEPGTPAMLPPLPHTEGRPNRLTLARWLVDPSHPLTSRVAVNRYWQMYFGTGLVKTSENFGSQGEPPSHPALLDWLATEFIRTKWDVKAMQRLIVTSAAYRRASQTTPALVEKDPENRLLARGPRYRLPAEMVRDNALAVSGLLNEEVGGKSVFPYQPAGLWEEMAFGDGFSMQSYVPSTGADLYRRSMYTFWKRTSPPAQLTTFDAPDREKCTARRTITNTPLQALVLLNDPTYLEAARVLAEKVLKEAPSTNRRAALAFELATARPATKSELSVLTRLLKQQTAYYKRAPEEAAALLTNGESKYDKSVPPVELAAWTMVASSVLNLDETISKE